MQITSPEFKNGAQIPKRYTCDSKNINPELLFSDIPAGAKSLVLIMDDPDSPTGVWNHWLVWNISPDIHEIQEGNVPSGALEGKTTFGEIGYGGPCPHKGRHRYFFKLYALDTVLGISAGVSKEVLINAMKAHILTEAELLGTYERKK